MTHSITVYGTPAPQGSKSFKGFNKAGRAILAESSAKVKPWREDVVAAVERYLNPLRPTWQPLDCAQIVRMIFTVTKPASAPKTRRTAPDRMPDLDKLARSTGDALKTARLIKDDSLIVEFSRLAKVYPGEDPEALASPGVIITLDNWLDAPLDDSLVCIRCGGFAPTHKCIPAASLKAPVPVPTLMPL